MKAAVKLTPEQAIRWSTIAVVAGVAAVAGWVSYRHALDVVRAHGETGAVAFAYPFTIDGLIYAGSMALLDAARRGAAAPPIAWPLLGVGVAATMFVNVLAGLASGPLGAAVAAWPALALVGSYELLMVIVRAGTRQPAATPAAAATGNGHDELSQRFRPWLERGEVPGVAAIKKELRCGQDRAQQARDYLREVVATRSN